MLRNYIIWLWCVSVNPSPFRPVRHPEQVKEHRKNGIVPPVKEFFSSVVHMRAEMSGTPPVFVRRKASTASSFGREGIAPI